MTPDWRAENDLRYIQRGCTRFRQLDLSDDDDAVRERMALDAEWDDAIGALPRIVAEAEHGKLSPPTLQLLREVAEEVARTLPTIRQLRYPLPDASALAKALTFPIPTESR
jgi:hypothetical protein